MIPYTGTKNHRVPFMIPGLSEFHQLEDIQYTLDDTITQIAINNQLTGNNQRVIDYAALEENVTINNNPGTNYPSKPGKALDAIHLVPQSGISPQALTLYNLAISAKDDISGVSQWSRGQAFAADSGKKVQNLDAIGTRRIAGPLWNIEHSVAREAMMVLKNVRQFVPDDKVWRISGMSDEKLAEFNQNGANLRVMPNKDIIVSLKDLPLDLEYDVNVEPMGNMPTSREAKLEMLIKLAQVMPSIPPWILLKYVDIPELAEEAKRLEIEWVEMQRNVKEIQEQLDMDRESPSNSNSGNENKSSKPDMSRLLQSIQQGGG